MLQWAMLRTSETKKVSTNNRAKRREELVTWDNNGHLKY